MGARGPVTSGGRRVSLTVALVAVLTAVGVALAVWMLVRGGESRASAAPRPPAIGQFLPTSFGSFGVRAIHIEPWRVPRGVEGIVAGPKVLLQVVVSLVNVGKRPVVLPPADFLLHGRLTDPPTQLISPREPVLLAPSTRIDLPLEFVVKRQAGLQRLHFSPSPDSPPIFVALVRTIRPLEGGPLHAHSGH